MSTCAGVQKLSRPMERCHEISQCTPVIAQVTAATAHHTYQGTATVTVRAKTEVAKTQTLDRNYKMSAAIPFSDYERKQTLARVVLRKAQEIAIWQERIRQRTAYIPIGCRSRRQLTPLSKPDF